MRVVCVFVPAGRVLRELVCEEYLVVECLVLWCHGAVVTWVPSVFSWAFLAEMGKILGVDG